MIRPCKENERRAHSEKNVRCEYTDVNIPGKRRRGRQNLRWKDACKRDMTKVSLNEDNTTNRAAWRNKIISYTGEPRWRDKPGKKKTCRVNSRSWLGKRPFCTSCAAMELAVTGHFPVCNVDLPVSLFSVCHALRLEWVKSIDDTVSFHLCRRFSSKTLSSDAAVDADSVFSESICSLYSYSHSSSQHGI